MSKHLEGTPEGHGLLQTLRPVQERFKKAIRQTAPDFRSTTSPKDGVSRRQNATNRWGSEEEEEEEEEEEGNGGVPEFLRAEEPDAWSVDDDESAIYVDEVMQRAQQ